MERIESLSLGELLHLRKFMKTEISPREGFNEAIIHLEALIINRIRNLK